MTLPFVDVTLVTSMVITHNPDARTLLVRSVEAPGQRYADGNHEPDPGEAWMLFQYGAEVKCIAASSNIMYHRVVTGIGNVSTTWTQTVWQLVRDTIDLLRRDADCVARSDNRLPPSRITVSVASYLAKKDRVDRFGGFSGEREHLPDEYVALGVEDREVVDARLRGESVR